MSMRVLPAVIGLTTVLLMASASARAQGVDAEQACTPDVMRLCQELVSDGNRGKITACLRRKRLALSPDCRKVFSGGGRRHHRRHRGD